MIYLNNKNISSNRLAVNSKKNTFCGGLKENVAREIHNYRKAERCCEQYMADDEMEESSTMNRPKQIPEQQKIIAKSITAFPKMHI